jgi:hypothetical protein
MSETADLPPILETEKPKRRWLLPTLVGVIAFVAGIGVGAAVGSGSDPTTTSTDAAAGRPIETSEPAEEPSPEPEPEPVVYTPTAEDFELTVKTLEKQCFGSAGCNVTFRIEVGYGGPTLDPATTYEVIYEVTGGEDPLINTLTVTGDSYEVDQEESLGTTSSDAELSAKVTDVSEF